MTMMFGSICADFIAVEKKEAKKPSVLMAIPRKSDEDLWIWTMQKNLGKPKEYVHEWLEMGFEDSKHTTLTVVKLMCAEVSYEDANSHKFLRSLPSLIQYLILLYFFRNNILGKRVLVCGLCYDELFYSLLCQTSEDMDMLHEDLEQMMIWTLKKEDLLTNSLYNRFSKDVISKRDLKKPEENYVSSMTKFSENSVTLMKKSCSAQETKKRS
ncbi:hypothetical protein Tco_0972046 [Tanacetum coccineum]